MPVGAAAAHPSCAEPKIEFSVLAPKRVPSPFLKHLSAHADGERQGLQWIHGGIKKVTTRRVCGYIQVSKGSSAFAVGMLRR